MVCDLNLFIYLGRKRGQRSLLRKCVILICCKELEVILKSPNVIYHSPLMLNWTTPFSHPPLENTWDTCTSCRYLYRQLCSDLMCQEVCVREETNYTPSLRTPSCVTKFSHDKKLKILPNVGFQGLFCFLFLYFRTNGIGFSLWSQFLFMILYWFLEWNMLLFLYFKLFKILLELFMFLLKNFGLFLDRSFKWMVIVFFHFKLFKSFAHSFFNQLKFLLFGFEFIRALPHIFFNQLKLFLFGFMFIRALFHRYPISISSFRFKSGSWEHQHMDIWIEAYSCSFNSSSF